MSHGFMVYAVDLEALSALVGSRDGRLRRELRARFAEAMDSTDRQVGDAVRGACPDVRTALAELIEGGPFDRDSGMLYTYAFKILCMDRGRFLPAPALCPFRGRLRDDLDAFLGAHNVHSVRVWELAWGSLPIRALPEPDEFPGRGHLSAAAVHAALEELKAVPDEAIPHDLRPGFEVLRGWLGEADAEGVGLVAFYH